MRKLEISNKCIKMNPLQDAVYEINNVLFDVTENVEIDFTLDQYDLKTTYACEDFIYMSNNDFGHKNIAFPIVGKKNIVIDGHGSTLNGIGRISPFYISESENVTIRNFVIDYERPFFSQGEVLDIAEDGVVIKIDKTLYPYIIKDTVVTFVGTDYTSDFTHGILEYSKENVRPEEDAVDNGIHGVLVGEELEEGILKIKNKFRQLPHIGNILTIKHERRFVPAISINKSKNITLENIWVKHAGTMGVVAQFSENITLNQFRVEVDLNTDRVISANADATHFVGCKGTILIENSRFFQQLDDIFNVHGNYLRVHKVIDSKNIIVEIPHKQQVGAFGIEKNTKVMICNDKTMLNISENQVKNYRVINNKFYEIELTEAFDFMPEQQYCLEDIDCLPNVIIRDCIGGKNRARGLLLTTAGDILIENNDFDTEGAVLKISGDMNSWYESGYTRNVVVRNNKMQRRNHQTWGIGVFDIDPEMDELVEGNYYHKNIQFIDNEITLNDFPLVYGQSVENIEFTHNTFIGENITSEEDLEIRVKNLGNITYKDNKIS